MGGMTVEEHNSYPWMCHMLQMQGLVNAANIHRLPPELIKELRDLLN